jgi:pyruvate/oxaloacetate carboxyltransferase
MDRAKFKAQAVLRSKPVIELLRSLSREEILELIAGEWHIAHQINERQIADAKSRVARRHADQAFEQYDKLSREAIDMPKNTIDELVAWGQKYKEAERFLHKYERLWKRANLLQFGPRKKEVAHAAE